MSKILLFKREEKSINRVINKYNFDEAQKEDIFQEVFIKFWTNYQSIRDKSQIGAWLRRVTSNCCNTMYTKRSKTLLIEETYQEQASECIFLKHKKSLEHEKLVVKANTAVMSLPVGNAQKVAKSYYIQGNTVSDIALELDMKKNTVLSHLRRSRIKLKKTAFSNS